MHNFFYIIQKAKELIFDTFSDNHKNVCTWKTTVRAQREREREIDWHESQSTANDMESNII